MESVSCFDTYSWAQWSVAVKSKGFGVGQTWISSVGLATSYLGYVGQTVPLQT